MARKQGAAKNLYLHRATPDSPSHLDNLWLISGTIIRDIRDLNEGSQRNFRIYPNPVGELHRCTRELLNAKQDLLTFA